MSQSDSSSSSYEEVQDSHAVQDKITKMENSIRGFKGSLTRRINEAKSALLAAGARTVADVPESRSIDTQIARPTPYDVSALVECKKRMLEAYDKIEKAYERLQAINVAKFDAYETSLDKEAKRKDIFTSFIAAVVNKGSSSSSANGSQAGARPSSEEPRPNKALKPFKLEVTHSPVIFKSWLGKFKIYYSSSRFYNATLEEQHGYLFQCISLDLGSLITQYVSLDTPIFSDSHDVVSVISILEEQFKSEYPLFKRRLDFFESRQAENQPFSVWFANLIALANEAKLHSMKVDDLIIMRCLTGTTDVRLLKKFLKQEKQTLEQFKKVAKQHEISTTTMKALGNTHAFATRQESYGRRNVKSSRGNSSNQKSSQIPSLEELQSQNRCTRCGSKSHRSGDCKHKNSTCHGCNMSGHLQSVCQKTLKSGSSSRSHKSKFNKSRVTVDQADQKFSKPARSSTSSNASSSASDTSSQYSCQNKTFSIRARAVTIARKVGSLPTPRINVTIQSSGQEFKFDALPDTGSTRTIVSYDIAKRYGLKIKTKQKEALFAANDQLMPCEGKLDLNISYMGRTVQVDAIVTSAMRNEVLISWHDLISLRVISHTFPRARVCNVDSLEKIQKDYPTVISNCLNKNPMTGPPMRIHLKEDVKPKRIVTARQVPVHWQKSADKVIQRAIDDGIIKKAEGPSTWILPGFFVPKGNVPNNENEIDLRLVVDFSPLNRYVERPVHPFPSSRDIANAIPKDSVFFCKMDCVQGYHQIALDEESSALTTFILPSGRYRYCRAPMGLNASSDEWCKRSDEAIQGLTRSTKAG